VRPTRARVLVALALGAALVAYSWFNLTATTLPVMPWTLPVVLVGLAAGVLFLAVSLRRRLRGEPGTKPVDPIGAARMAVMSKACSHAGALLAGGYAGIAAYLLVEFDSGARRTDALVTGLSALAAAALLAAGLLLERVCRVQPPDEEPPLGTTA
jgi:hypothetical protein